MNKAKLKVVIACSVLTLFFVLSTLSRRQESLKAYSKRYLRIIKNIHKRQETRKNLVSAVCNESLARNDSLENNIQTLQSHFDHFIVDDIHKLIYCFVPKVASTNWKRVLLSINADHLKASNPLSIKGSKSQARNIFQTLDQFNDTTEIIRRLNSYTKFVFVRNPFERLLSAFRNKFESVYNDYFRLRFGRKIIKMYRVNSTKQSLETGNDVTFNEFLSYIADLDVYDFKSSFNEHWRPISDLCFPCFIEFDIIGKLETLEEDAFFVMWKANLFNSIRFPHRKETYSSVPTAYLLNKYYKFVPLDLMNKLLKLYEQDLKLFNYGIEIDK
ncbi:carbohydrate sulfotransferase 11-like protein [Dinothrombium tinctorium]|uniref:Carbohydrate sulfotransferase n=1 Tax=Dinothrombium tinctorium TaxID=1965070 RepID=A0A3S3PRY6_9ACAR|nr:carbohydrate sulfotransferase 11-like protein [Dinothrombium tinctorium]RWS07076.1 carbohydrate sulfotransferase 11-like protein [Dinothrombium tinctorium]